MTSTTFNSAFGAFELRRRPARHDPSLQAWDAADEYLLDTLQQLQAGAEKILVVNDQFGALTVPLNRARVSSWSDSITAHMALSENIARNFPGAPFAPQLIPGTETPSQLFDSVLWRIPKTQALFEQQADALRTCAGPDTLVLAGGMLKHLPEKMYEALSEFANVEVLPARKKARVYRLTFDPQRRAAIAQTDKALLIAEYGLQLRAGPNVFARDKFDIGARFFIEQFAQLPRAERIADLGCGSGVLGLLAKRCQPWAAIEFFDDSYQAVAAAERNYRDNGFADGAPAARFHVDDGFSSYRGEPFDLILCNPPFHQGHVVGDQIARQLFAQSRQQLRRGGELWIVGNRHLQYHIVLKKIFGNCRQIAANSKFVVLAARA